MTLGLCFWVLMLLWLVFGLYWYRVDLSKGNYAPFGNSLLLFILLLLLGWGTFGPPIR